MFNKFKKIIALDNPFRLEYHKLRAILANIKYGFPSKDMIIIGVTGTNGKTTTSNIITKGLKAAGKKVFMFSTVNIIIDDKEYQNDTKMTSPDVFELQRLLSIAKKEGCKIAVIETASHGILMNRIWGIEYDILVLTNITQDHLDLHRTMTNYVNTKLSIFKKLISYKRKKGIRKSAIINKDSKYADLFINETYDNSLTFGTSDSVNLKASNIIKKEKTTSFDMKIPGKDIHIETSLKGDFNIQNILAAVGVFMSLGIDKEQITEMIEKTSGVPGRLESVETNKDFQIIIDYAHTEDALENVLQTIKSFPGINKIITVFGATGDRDKSKRSKMGQVVSNYSDIVILTEDDNYSEKIEEIIKDVLPGIERKETEDFWIITTRKEAILSAINMATKGDIILIAGKGDEHIMMTNKGAIEYHDKTVVQEILKGIEDNKILTK